MSEATSLIDPTAIIAPEAQLGRRVKVGPGAIIGPGVTIGDDCEIRARAVLCGDLTIGARTQIGYHAVIGAEPQDTSYQGAPSRTVIGEDNIIREFVTIHRGTGEGTATVVGNHCFLMVGAHVAHNCVLADHVTLVNNVLLAGYVTVDERAFLGGGAVVHQFTRIGKLAMVRGQVALGLDVPPFCMAVAVNTVFGLNRIGLRRAGYDASRRRQVQRLFDLFYRSGLNRQQAIEAIEAAKDLHPEDAKTFADFLRPTKRGVCRLGRSAEGESA